MPAFTEQTQMMYVKTTDDLREYILDGAPKRRRERFRLRRAHGGGRHSGMPAYRALRVVAPGRGPGRVSARRRPDRSCPRRTRRRSRAAATLTAEYHCFSCHGPLGAGGIANPASFKGYVPGLLGRRISPSSSHDDDELHRWIADGQIPRIAEHPIGGWFFRRQAVKMPAYGKFPLARGHRRDRRLREVAPRGRVAAQARVAVTALRDWIQARIR